MVRIMKTLRVSIGLVISFLVLLPVTSFAQVKPHDASTAAMVELCKSRNDIDAQNFCFGFGEGVYQAYLASRPVGSKPSICFAANNHTREQILDDFLNKKVVGWVSVAPPTISCGNDLAAATVAKSLLAFQLVQ